jgi:superfamily II DNA or RNA helicase
VILKQSIDAYYRFAFSGTPYREDGTEMLIQASFGKVLMHASSSELIRRGRLVRPYILMIDAPWGRGEACGSWLESHKRFVVGNAERNRMIAAITDEVRGIGPTMLLVKEISHGEALHKLIPGSVFIKGGDTKRTKDGAIADLMDGTLPILIATPIGDEGLNLRSLAVLILADAGQSSIKLTQRVGRSLRIFPGKSCSLVIDFRDGETTLAKHATRRRSLYLAEEEFVVADVSSKGWRAYQGIPGGR